MRNKNGTLVTGGPPKAGSGDGPKRDVPGLALWAGLTGSRESALELRAEEEAVLGLTGVEVRTGAQRRAKELPWKVAQGG